MKKLIVVLFFFALISPVIVLSEEIDHPKLYYINVPVERIFPTASGYVVQYRNSTNLVGTVGIPIEWFTNSGGKAERVHLDNPRGWPTMTVFYSDGEFSHVRLYVHSSRSHQTWGTVPMGADVSRFFGDGESFNLQY